MSSYGVSEIGTRVDGRVNGASLTVRPIAGSRSSGGSQIMGAEAGVHNKLAEVVGVCRR